MNTQLLSNIQGALEKKDYFIKAGQIHQFQIIISGEPGNVYAEKIPLLLQVTEYSSHQYQSQIIYTNPETQQSHTYVSDICQSHATSVNEVIEKFLTIHQNQSNAW